MYSVANMCQLFIARKMNDALDDKSAVVPKTIMSLNPLTISFSPAREKLATKVVAPTYADSKEDSCQQSMISKGQALHSVR